MFVFLHIPKAAGTTFREIIFAEINPRKRLSLDDISRIAYAPDEWLNSHDFISGHFGVSLLRRLLAGCRVITMLRNPVARTISQYNYFKELSERDTDFNTYAALLRDRSLKEILSDPNDVVINSLFRNGRSGKTPKTTSIGGAFGYSLVAEREVSLQLRAEQSQEINCMTHFTNAIS